MSIYDKNVVAMEEYYLRGELEFLNDIYGQAVLALGTDDEYVPKAIEKRTSQVKSRLYSLELNKKCLFPKEEAR